MVASCETRYISTACNRTPSCVSWGYNNLICFGACNSVAIYDPQELKIRETLVHHNARVNSVRWICNRQGKPEFEFISASSDKKIALWSQDSSGSYSVSCSLAGHEDAVTFVDGIYLTDVESYWDCPSALIASSSADGTVRIWRREKSMTTCDQVIHLKKGLCLSLRLCLLPGTCIPLLAVAADDSSIYLYSDGNSEKKFQTVHSLVGHEDWVRCIDLAIHDDGDVLVASAGQDNLIRIWRLSPRESEKHKAQCSQNEIKLEEDIFSIESQDKKYYWAAILDSVLAGHEGWVYEVCWHPRLFKNDIGSQPLHLLSASLDKSMVLWSPGSSVDQNCVWLESARVGEVGGNTLGFYGCQFSPDGNFILAHGYLGSFHLWHKIKDCDLWQPSTTVGGHFGDVTDMNWEPGGQFLISVSADQTTRLHAPWVLQEKNRVTWHELSRPQVHGYDMQCLAVISRYKFASGAEEKVVRVFQAPSNFIENLVRLCGVEKDSAEKLVVEGPLGASVPSLGLSNKAVYEKNMAQPDKTGHPKDEFSEAYFVPVVSEEPPKEEDLLQNTLWPEVQKLYGHGYEVFSLAASNDGKLVASACKATNTQDAAIILWNTETWQQMQKLESHELTVTQLAFSPNDQFLLSVSRDRRWSIFEQLQDQMYELSKSTNKSCGIHTRIIWCCAWTADSKFFATGSRDGKIVVWGGNVCISNKSPLGVWSAASEPLTLKESVTSLAFAPLSRNEHYTLAAGFENGCIWVMHWTKGPTNNWSTIISLDQNTAHHLTVKRLAFRPLRSHTTEESISKQTVLELASAGADHAVKINAITFSL